MAARNWGQGARREPGRRSEDGASTVVALALSIGSLSLIAALGMGGQAFLVHARADGTADLAAIAAADAARGRAPGEPCEVAKELVEREGGELEDCVARRDLGLAGVTVSMELPGPLPRVTAEAVAGDPNGRYG